MSREIDNSELSRKSAKSGVHEDQNGGRRQKSVKQQEADPHYDVVTAPSVSPRITEVHGLSIIETDLPVLKDLNRNDRNNNNHTGYDRRGPAEGEMKKLSRKKIQDERSIDETKPLKLSVRDLDDNRPRKNMEDESRMDEIDLQGGSDEEGAAKQKSGQQKAKRSGDMDLSPVVEAAVAAFAESKTKNKGVDLNKNTAKNGRDAGSALQNNPHDVEISHKPKPFHTNHGVDRTDSFEIATKDDVDAGSVYSLFMEKDFRYHFQHPYFRLFAAYFVTFCNFLIYAEDPVAHSRSECNIPVIGNDFSFVGMKYLPNAWSLLKVLLWITGTIVGMIVGKLFVHTFLFNRVLRLKMFHDDKGSWMTMFLTVILSVFIFSYIYNAFLLIGGDYTDPYHISPYMGVSNKVFMKAAATGTWCGDFFTAWMVTDMMLQEKLYPEWAKPVRKWWNTRYNRIILFWVVVVLTSFIVVFVIATDYINWDSLNRDFLHTNEISRAFLASFILVMDITIVMQDWDFPHFVSAIDIKLPGINTAHIRFKIPKLFRKLEHWQVHISGKWFNYGILFIVILLDLNMWKNQIFFAPFDYGQYVDEDGRIHTVEDNHTLKYANRSTLTFEYRNSTINPYTGERYILGDTLMNARYNGYSLALKGLAFVPSLAVFLVFGIMVLIYGRRPKPTKENPYGGRLRKRKRRRFNARKKWNSIRMWFAGAGPVLTHYQQSRAGRGTNSADTEIDAEGGQRVGEKDKRTKTDGEKGELTADSAKSKRERAWKGGKNKKSSREVVVDETDQSNARLGGSTGPHTAV